ncbi:MAG: hypothetical protein M1829_006285 [Trizodia sp. TS-e1964]|nr:MAG: hypothetical protein M1829_006285 [Trizodia sp. TS-e1964]
MSSMRNAVQRRPHRERAQPEERSKWGLLEKHKDYSQRAKNYNEKKAKLKALRAKAQDRNPDEFHFGMMRGSQKKQASARRTESAGMSVEQVRLLKTQDMAYLRTAAMKARRERERLEQGFLLVRGVAKGVDDAEAGEVPGGKRRKGRGGVPRKIMFVDSVEEQQQAFLPDSAAASVSKDADAARDPEAEAEAKALASKPLSKQEMEKVALERKQARALHRRRMRAYESRKTQLASARARERQLAGVERALDLQRARMAKTPTVGGVGKSGVKWKVHKRLK